MYTKLKFHLFYSLYYHLFDYYSLFHYILFVHIFLQTLILIQMNILHNLVVHQDARLVDEAAGEAIADVGIGEAILELEIVGIERSVATVERAEKREERRVLRDRKKLTVALRPSRGREGEPKHADFCDKW